MLYYCFLRFTLLTAAAVATIILDADVVVWFSTHFVQSSRDAEANVPHAQKLSRIKTFLTAIFRLIHDTIISFCLEGSIDIANGQ